MKRWLPFLLFLLLAGTASAGLITIAGGRGVAQPSTDDWYTAEVARAGANVVVASRLDSTAIRDDWYLNDSTGDHISFDATIVYPGSAGSLKHVVLNSDGAASGQTSVPFGTSFGAGDKFSVSMAIYFDEQEAFAPWPPGDDGSAKIFIVSRDANGASPTNSNQLNELVAQFNFNQGEITGYWQGYFAGDTNLYTALPFDRAVNNDCQSGDIVGQPDRVGTDIAGVDPDDGTSWHLCEQYRFKYAATHYSARSNSIQTSNTRRGLGNPFSGGFRPIPGEWTYLQMGVENNAAGFGVGKPSRIVLMAAHEDGPWVLLYDEDTANEPGAGPDYNAVNLLPYTTNRTSGGRQVSSRSGELASCFDIWNVAPTHATGDGTLSWNASNSRLTWQASGDSPGTARGYSAANGLYLLNLISSTTSTNFINGEITPAGCPGTNTSETVTIATDRPDTQRNYGPVIVVEGALTYAPDGSAPPVTL